MLTQKNSLKTAQNSSNKAETLMVFTGLNIDTHAKNSLD